MPNKDECEKNKIIEEKNSNNVKKLKETLIIDENTIEFIYQEGGWGWIVVIASGYCLGILIGMLNNYALLYNELDRVYNGTENHVVYSAWIGSVSTGVQYIFCAIGSILTDFYGPRKIGLIGGLLSTLGLILSVFVTEIKLYFLTYGFGFGVGQALLLSSTLAILPHYFNRQLSLANGIMNLIGAIVVVLLPIFTANIIKNFGLRQTFMFLSGLSAVTVLMSLTYKPLLPHNKTDAKNLKFKDSLGFEVLKKKKFAIWCIASAFGMFGYLIPIVNIDHHSIKAFPDYDPMYINIVFGAASGVGALLFGKLGDLAKFNRVHFHTLVFFVYGIIQLAIPSANNFFVLLVLMSVLGLLDGVLLCFIVPISYDLAKSSKLANHAAGYYHVSISLPSIAGPAVAGKIYEDFHSYNLAFYIGAGTCLIGALIQIILIPGIDFIEKFKKPKIKEIIT